MVFNSLMGIGSKAINLLKGIGHGITDLTHGISGGASFVDNILSSLGNFAIPQIGELASSARSALQAPFTNIALGSSLFDFISGSGIGGLFDAVGSLDDFLGNL